mmetsp:Transcript_31305/g.93458  ORF Transcript_31305/g.93458 Transcript_31305/m.93458 type:complete len:106 (+) Transcript_31305:2880-3197(+)
MLCVGHVWGGAWLSVAVQGGVGRCGAVWSSDERCGSGHAACPGTLPALALHSPPLAVHNAHPPRVPTLSLPVRCLPAGGDTSIEFFLIGGDGPSGTARAPLPDGK